MTHFTLSWPYPGLAVHPAPLQSHELDGPWAKGRELETTRVGRKDSREVHSSVQVARRMGEKDQPDLVPHRIAEY